MCMFFSCLEDNAYDHKTATFYLLAERLLRKQYEDLKCANGKESYNFNEIRYISLFVGDNT